MSVEHAVPAAGVSAKGTDTARPQPVRVPRSAQREKTQGRGGGAEREGGSAAAPGESGAPRSATAVDQWCCRFLWGDQGCAGDGSRQEKTACPSRASTTGRVRAVASHCGGALIRTDMRSTASCGGKPRRAVVRPQRSRPPCGEGEGSAGGLPCPRHLRHRPVPDGPSTHRCMLRGPGRALGRAPAATPAA